MKPARLINALLRGGLLPLVLWLWRGLLPAAWRAALARHGLAFRNLGPVGLIHSVRLARVERRLKQIDVHVDQERYLHQVQLESLNYDRNQLLGTQMALQASLKLYVDHCAKRGGGA